MFIHWQCELLCRLSAIEYHSPHLPSSGFDPKRLSLLTDKNIWRTRHGCFAPVRFYVDIPQFEDYEVILHLRDPRDVLVSMFYAYCYIHPGEVAANTAYRREAAARGIDAFVLDKASGNNAAYPGDYGTGGHMEHLIGHLPKRYMDYIEHFLGKPNVALVKYEEMVADYRGWLTKFIRPFPIKDKGKVIDDLAAQSSAFFPHRAADVMQHVRHVTPGDHKAKLKASTIRRLDAVFSTVLDALEYERFTG